MSKFMLWEAANPRNPLPFIFDNANNPPILICNCCKTNSRQHYHGVFCITLCFKHTRNKLFNKPAWNQSIACSMNCYLFRFYLNLISTQPRQIKTFNC